MRIGLIVPGFSADENDWCIPALLNFVRALARHVELEVFALRYPHRRDTYRIGDATIHSLGWAQRRGLHSATLYATAIAHIQRRHRQKKFDLLHAFWADEPAWVGSIAAKRIGVPLLVSLAGGELSHLPTVAYGLQRHFVQRQLIGWSLRHASHVTASSAYFLEMARAQGLKRLSLAPLGVDIELFSPSNATLSSSPASPPLPLSCRAVPTGEGEGLGEGVRPPLLLNVGSLIAVKRQLMLLQAMRRVITKVPTAHLQIVGEGPLKNDLVAAMHQLGLSEHVTLCGAMAHDQLPAHYRAADLFIQSSLHEAQGMAVLEAAACGVPSVGTSVGVLGELTPDAARTVPVGDEAALAAAIIDLLKHADQRQAMGNAARARVEEFYSVEVCMQQFVKLYQDLAAMKSPRYRAAPHQ